MRRIATSGGVALVAGLAALASTALATPSHGASSKCPAGHSHLIVADAQGEVYLRVETEDIIACAYGSKHLHLLGGPPGYDAEGGGELTHYTLAGAVLAYENYVYTNFPATGHPESWRYVYVENLRAGQVLHKLPTGTSTASAVGIGPVVAIVVKSDGAVAWIAGNNNDSEHATSFEIHAVDKTGSRLLASGGAIDPHSLALAGSTLYWTQEGKPMSATLH